VVIATVSSDAKAAHATLAGADVVINYRSADVVSRVLDITQGDGVDRISEVDFGVNLPVTAKILAKQCVGWAPMVQPASTSPDFRSSLFSTGWRMFASVSAT